MIYEQLYHPDHQTFTGFLTEYKALTELFVLSYDGSHHCEYRRITFL